MDEIVTLNRSYFRVMARNNGSLQITAIGATIDHGDEGDITNFVEMHLSDPVIAPIMQGGEMRWEATGIVALLLTDNADARQALMRDFLFMAMLSGRFRPSEGTQRLMWADPETGTQPPFPPVPAQWWAELDAGTAPPISEYLDWYMVWVASQ